MLEFPKQDWILLKNVGAITIDNVIAMYGFETFYTDLMRTAINTQCRDTIMVARYFAPMIEYLDKGFDWSAAQKADILTSLNMARDVLIQDHNLPRAHFQICMGLRHVPGF